MGDCPTRWAIARREQTLVVGMRIFAYSTNRRRDGRMTKAGGGSNQEPVFDAGNPAARGSDRRLNRYLLSMSTAIATVWPDLNRRLPATPRNPDSWARRRLERSWRDCWGARAKQPAGSNHGLNLNHLIKNGRSNRLTTSAGVYRSCPDSRRDCTPGHVFAQRRPSE